MATKRFAPKLRIKTGDTVMVITGEDKGKTGTVTKVFPTENKAIVEGVRVKKKHRKPNAQAGIQGGIEDIELPINISNLMLSENGKPTRIGRREEGGKLVRFSKKTGKTL
jgi:large subunit ribosomal protein L24